MGQNKDLINTICLCMTQYIYASKCNKTEPNFINLIQKILDLQRSE